MPPSKIKRIVYSMLGLIYGVRKVDDRYFAMYRDKGSGTKAAPLMIYKKITYIPENLSGFDDPYKAQLKLDRYIQDKQKSFKNEQCTMQEKKPWSEITVQ